MISKFIDIGVPENIVRAMIDMGWREPTPIQLKSIPIGIRNIDMFAQAQTGTGKTGAYGSIILSTIPAGKKIPSSVVIVPTKELANKVSNEIKKMSKYSGHICVPIYGDLGVKDQIKKLYGGCDIIIGTPRKIKDIIIKNALNWLGISIIVIDEADKMFDIGFLEDIKFILKNMPMERHTLFFSAKIDKNVKKIALDYMMDHRGIFITEDEAAYDITG